MTLIELVIYTQPIACSFLLACVIIAGFDRLALWLKQ